MAHARKCSRVHPLIPCSLRFPSHVSAPVCTWRVQYHWFDGDGMLHGVVLQDGRAAYVNRWVQTKKLQKEDTLGRSISSTSVGDLVDEGLSGILGLVKMGLVQVGVVLWRSCRNICGACMALCACGLK